MTAAVGTWGAYLSPSKNVWVLVVAHGAGSRIVDAPAQSTVMRVIGPAESLQGCPSIHVGKGMTRVMVAVAQRLAEV